MLNYDNENKCGKLQQYKSRFSLIVEQIRTFPSSTKFVRKFKGGLSARMT